MEAANSISSDDGVRTDSGTSKPQVKRSEEGAQLLLPAETRVTDGIGTNAVNNSGKAIIIVFGSIPTYVYLPLTHTKISP